MKTLEILRNSILGFKIIGKNHLGNLIWEGKVFRSGMDNNAELIV